MKHTLRQLIILCEVVTILLIRLSNFDVAETRLLIDYWYAWVLISAAIIGGVSLTIGKS